MLCPGRPSRRPWFPQLIARPFSIVGSGICAVNAKMLAERVRKTARERSRMLSNINAGMERVILSMKHMFQISVPILSPVFANKVLENANSSCDHKELQISLISGRLSGKSGDTIQ
jgi:hypothetical protein